MKNYRFPTMTESLLTLNGYKVPVNSVLDVGVLTGTGPLISAYPHLKHHLFEPVDIYFPKINQVYKNIDHTIHQVALSDFDGEAWQVHYCIDNSGRVTHSRLADHQVTAEEEPRLVKCTPVRMTRLDTLSVELDAPEPWLLKIDVDGHELPILKGAEASLRRCSVVVMEAPIATLVGRALYLQDHGFKLFDIVDLSYYYKSLSQVDLVFVSNQVVSDNGNLRPWQTQVFDWDEWAPLNHEFFSNNLKNQ